jgi:hypothetical protein
MKVVVLALFVFQLPLAKAPVLAAEILASKPICWGKLLPRFAKVTMPPSLLSLKRTLSYLQFETHGGRG